jgi:hypothetical protein
MHVTFDRERCDIEAGGNLLVTHSLNNQCNNLLFALSHPDRALKVSFPFQKGMFGNLKKE